MIIRISLTVLAIGFGLFATHGVYQSQGVLWATLFGMPTVVAVYSMYLMADTADRMHQLSRKNHHESEGTG